MYTWILVFYCVLEKYDISSKIKISKVTDYAALNTTQHSLSGWLLVPINK